jgi:hypothetical protein
MFKKLDVLSGEMKASSGPYISSLLSSTYPLSQFFYIVIRPPLDFFIFDLKKNLALKLLSESGSLDFGKVTSPLLQYNKYAHEKLKDLTL